MNLIGVAMFVLIGYQNDITIRAVSLTVAVDFTETLLSVQRSSLTGFMRTPY